MPHADASFLPPDIISKNDFWDHVYEQLVNLLSSQRSWISNCANASSLVYTSLLAFETHFGSEEKAVNWCGFYIDSSLFPTPSLSSVNKDDPAKEEENLLLGPFCGKPACQFINVTPGKARGVCADAFIQRNTILVPDVDSYPGHIACDGDTKSEIVCPLVFEGRCIGVLDLDCLAVRGFDEDDKKGLEKISKLVVESCDW